MSHSKSSRGAPNRNDSAESYDPGRPPEKQDFSHVFDTLDKRICAAIDASRNKTVAYDLSLSDLNLHQTCFRPKTTILDVNRAWKKLVENLKEQLVFTDYVGLLERAFQNQYSVNPSQLHHIKSLLDLLTQSVKNHARDNSIECRFVTLLEVILSYEENWTPSQEVSRFWVRLMQRIPSDVAPVNFRRKAYRVLVSLSWVPSSKGLLEACSFEETTKLTLDYEAVPLEVKRIMSHIRGGPLPRHDSVNQLMDRLKDETDVCVAITSERQGTGKTTLAAQVASHPSIIRVFSVMWLTNVLPSMSYEEYTIYLSDLCEQLHVPVIQWPVIVKRFEEPAIRKLREKKYMKEAKQLMSELFCRHEQNILLVLDDVRDASIIEWFRFDDRQSVIVTTPDQELDGVDWALELAPMSEEEAIELFLKEADLPVEHILGATFELRSIVQQCHCNPLCVRTIARWFWLKQITAGMDGSIEEISQELAVLKEDSTFCEGQATPNIMLFDVLSLMMGPFYKRGGNLSTLLILGFSSLVIVFPEAAPLEAVILLWGQILKNESLAVEELSKSAPSVGVTRLAWLIAEALVHMGVIAVFDKESGPWVQVHHSSYKDFAILMAKEMDLKDTFEETVSEWHLAFVTSYLSRNNRVENASQGSSWAYTTEVLLRHIFAGKMHRTAEMVLTDVDYVRARIEVTGWKRGIEAQVQDCVTLQHALEADSVIEIAASHVFSQTASLLTEEKIGNSDSSNNGQKTNDKSYGLFLIGFALAENGFFKDALAHFEMANDLVPSDEHLRASILYAIGWCLLSTNNTELAKKKIKASRMIMDHSISPHDLYGDLLQLFMDYLVESCDYLEAEKFYDSYVRQMRSSAQKNKIELGMALYKQGRLYFTMGRPKIAKDILDECVSWKKTIGETSMSLSMALSVLGDVNVELHMISKAKEHYEAALAVLRDLNCDDQHLDYRILAGKLQFLRGDFVTSFKSFELVRATIVEFPLTAYDQASCDLRYIARAYELRDDLATSSAILRESLILTDNRRFSLERAWGKMALGNCLVKMGKEKEALTCYEQSQNILIIKLGDCEHVIDIVNLIGSVYLKLGKDDEAIKLFDINLETTKKFGSIERVASIYSLLGEAFNAKCCFTEAASQFQECIHILKGECGSSHPDVANAFRRLGDVNVSGGNLEKARKFYNEALEIQRINFDYSLVADCLLRMGVLERKLGDFKSATEHIQEAYDILKKESNARIFSEVLFELGNLCFVQAQFEKAIKYYVDLLDGISELDILRAETYLALGHTKLCQGKYKDAAMDLEKVMSFTLPSSSFSQIDPVYLKASRDLGVVKFLMGREGEALNFTNDFVKLSEKIGEEMTQTLDYAVVQFVLGDIYEFRGQGGEATASWTRANEIIARSEHRALPLSASMQQLLDRRLRVGDTCSGYLSTLKREGINKSSDSIQSSTSFDEEILLRGLPLIRD
jgi:tetratricopeptide (TPR) repeat protein